MGENTPLTRYSAELIVPEDTRDEIAVMKGIATAFVMTVRDAQPHYEHQHENTGYPSRSALRRFPARNPQYIDSIFRTDYAQLGANDDDARLRLVIDQVASLTDRSAVVLYKRINGTPWMLGEKPLW